MNTRIGRIGKKLLSLLLTGCLCASLLPGAALAADAEETVDPDSYIGDISADDADAVDEPADDAELVIEEEAYIAPVSYAAATSGTCGDNLTWTLNTDTGVLTISGTGKMKDYSSFSNAPWYAHRSSITSVVIEDGVTYIGRYAFRGCTSLTSVTIPDSVTSIGDNAFYKCTGLTSVTIGNGVTSIGSYAFEDCTGLTSVTIGNGVTSIGDWAFAYCSSLTEILVSEGNTAYSSENGVLFNKDKTELICYPGGKETTHYVIPNSVTSIGKCAFRDCTSLTSVTIPDSVTSIGAQAFYDCTSLTSVTIPDSVTSIGAHAFHKCTGLTSVTIGNGVTSIGECAFMACTGLTSVTIPDSVTSIGAQAFCKCTGLTSVTIGNSMTGISNDAFQGCTSLTSITIPNSVVTIREYAFSGCTSLTDVYYSGSEDEWDAIWIASYNTTLTSATIHYRGYFGWNFRNNYDGFGYDSDYAIPEERYADVFGKAYVALAKRADEETYASMINSEWHGSCLGMSVTAVLFELGLLDWDNYSSLYITGGDLYEDGFPNVNDYYTELAWARDSFSISKYIYTVSGENSEITKLIEAYQIMQGRTSTDYLSANGSTQSSLIPNYYTKNEEKSNDTMTYYVHNADGNYISSMLEKIQTSAEPLVICMTGVGHAVVARTDKAPVETEDGWWRVYIYDPNNPFMPETITEAYGEDYALASYYANNLEEDRYLELNPELNQWRFIGSINGTTANDYYGSDADGNIKYMDTDEYNMELIFAFSVSEVGIPTDIDGTEPWIEQWADAIKQTTGILYSETSSFEIISPDGETLVVVADGRAVYLKDGVTRSFDLDYDTNESSSGGRITLPYTDFIVDYETGDDITIIGTDSVINAACSGVTTLDVSMEEDQVTVTGVDNVETSFKISSVYSSDEYTSVELDGILDSGDSVTVRLTNDRLTIDSSINGRSSLEVTSSNDSSPEFQVISVLDASAPAAEFEDVRDAEAYVPNDESNASTPGDLNGDGEVNASDLTILARHIGKVETIEDSTYLANADVTGDGEVDASDLTRLAQYVGKIISSLD